MCPSITRPNHHTWDTSWPIFPSVVNCTGDLLYKSVFLLLIFYTISYDSFYFKFFNYISINLLFSSTMSLWASASFICFNHLIMNLFVCIWYFNGFCFIMFYKFVSKWLHCSLLTNHINFANVFYTNIVKINILVNIELFVTNAKLIWLFKNGEDDIEVVRIKM
jgi:hypothetical protein